MSRIEVDKIQQQCGTTLTVGGGACKTAVLDATTVTLGRCGGTVSLASGATQSGFGRTGTVDWQTGSIKTTTFTAANGEGYFANTSGGAFTMNLPAGSAGDIVSVVDYTNSWQTHSLTITPNGSEKIGGIASSYTANTEGQSLTFVYVDSSEGWKNVQDSTSAVIGNAYIQASVSGACNTLATAPDCANMKVATFLGPGTFTVSQAADCAANNIVSYLVVGGGGAGGKGNNPEGGGGGGAGGYREVVSPGSPYTGSPLNGYPTPGNRITVSATAYPIQVGAGATTPSLPNRTGTPSIFSTVISAGGGRGAQSGCSCGATGGNGGSGGGGGSATGAETAGTGNTPPTTPAQGTNGGAGGGGPTGPGGKYTSGGGGGASEAGVSASGRTGGRGGAGTPSSISGSAVSYAGGAGGGGSYPSSPCFGGLGAASPCGTGGAGGCRAQGTAGTTNRGGGGGGAGDTNSGANGGSGIVIIRYRFQ